MADNLSQTVVGLGYVPVDRGDWEKNYQSNPETRYFNDNIAQYKGSAFIADVTAENAEGNAGTEDSPRYYITAKPYEESVEELNPGWKVFASDAEFAIKYFAQFFTQEENPEFCYVIVDKDQKILFGFKWNSEPYFGVGCPQQVKDYIEERISELSLDEYEDIVAFLQDFLDTDTTLKMLLDSLEENKVDKEEGKSLIDSEHADAASHIDNPEYLQVTTDSEDKVLEGIKSDGTKVIGGDLNVDGSTNINGDIRVLGNMELSGVSYKVIENPEYLAAWVDASDKVIFGLKADGKTYIGDADFLNDINNNQEAINEIKSYLANFDTLNIEALSSITAIESPEYIDVKVDSEDKILEGITTEGVKKINIPIDNGAAIIESVNNPEFIEAKVDAQGRLIEGINKNGEKIFGAIPPQIKQYIDENMPAGGSGVQSIEYDGTTGDMYATYDDESGVTDVYMEPNGDIYVESEE